MKKRIIILLICLGALGGASAQEFKVAKATGKLVIKLSSVSVEGYDGNEVIFSSQNKRITDERAAGLSVLSGTGITDNTGIGINVTDKGTTIEVNEVAPNLGKIKILVPKGMSISYNWQNMINASKIVFKNIQKEIDISARNNTIELEDVSGPISINSIYGSVIAKFKDKITGPITLVSMYGNVDVSVPLDTKASLKLKSSYGYVFAASEMKIDLKKRVEDGMVEYNSSNIAGNLNGGGIEFNLTSEYGKVYLRKGN
ncbi:DUF4097 family beta strand repeat-containing protein [Pedobacter sp. Hv1]|uniref:DUF4097 family beta strand repeat-containing protein n=1 Tax=Pedobacter sp. Hv1 TaxID=1740090 RepID=UPI0006D8917B|nr:DUF4097 family beta strand repeat-containing protein [Pedobacter sp. Hv1]KQC00075.1 hypothetical protein AQF98_14000 [Pedobacter sp. Hv1]